MTNISLKAPGPPARGKWHDPTDNIIAINTVIVFVNLAIVVTISLYPSINWQHSSSDDS